MRDDFRKTTINLLANRVGWKCSNPGCRRTTRGAGTEPTDVINIGVAAHITAAAKGGPRYDSNMTTQDVYKRQVQDVYSPAVERYLLRSCQSIRGSAHRAR